MVRSWYVSGAWIVAMAIALSGPNFAYAQLWKQFVPSDKKEAPAAENGAPANEFGLKQENGPWMIMAASFSGDGAEEQAQALAQEFRTRYRLPAYIHEMNFKQEETNPGRGIDEYGGPIRRRYQRGNQVRELAVLVGNFPSINDPNAQKTLDNIKTLQPAALSVDTDETSQSMAKVRQLEDALMKKLGKNRERGPMAQAFFTRNPMLPREYLVPKGVDSFIAKMNSGVENSLLDCQGKYTVRVATFRGKSILQPGDTETQEIKSFWNRNKPADDNPLVEAAENAHLLTEELRRHGWEAYEFHDRTESYVTIGSFDQVVQQLPDGRVLTIPEVERIIKTFSAAYDTPADPLSGIGNDATNQRLVDQQEQQVKLQMASQSSQMVSGLNPKHVKILKGSGKRVRVQRIIPMDVHPQAMEAPKRSISSAYAG